MNPPNPKVDWYFKKVSTWHPELIRLRKILLGAGLTEELKWGVPTYTWQGHNVVILHYFKDYCAILFVKGALLKDPKSILIRQTANVQAGRQIRFTAVKEIKKLESVIKAYIKEAIAVEKAGLKVPHKTTAEFPVAEEWQQALQKNHALKAAFEALTPGRQRAYLLYFAAAKQSKTREARVEKCLDQILEGLGLGD